MAVSIKIGKPPAPPEDPPVATVNLNIRKTLDGDIMIFDHADIDIVIMKEKQKIVAFAKDVMGGSIYGSLEGALLPSDDWNNIRLAIINLEKFVDEERPYFEFAEDMEDMKTDRLTDPDDEDSTELGEVPHEEIKGVMRPGYNHSPYWQSYTYE